MIDMRYKPYFLPQVHAPEEYVIQKLQDDGIDVEQVIVDPNELKPMQGIVFSNEVKDFDVNDMPNIWTSQDNDVVDGHHRYLGALMNDRLMGCNKVGLNAKDAARILNKIQDIYEYEQQQLKEVEVQDVINANNEIDSGMVEENILEMLDSAESPAGEGCKVIAYREKPLLDSSVIGNFFILAPQKGYDKYEIDFENLLDTNELGIDFRDQHPIDALAKTWFPNADFENMSKPYNLTPQQLKNKAIAEKAHKMGYDGIKYGDLMVQGLK